MALTFNPSSLVIESSASIPDLPAFHAALRDWEDSEGAAVHPVTHTYKRVDLGGGASFHAVALINGWRLRFPTAGNYAITGNLSAEIIPASNVYVERQTSAAFVTTAVGGSGPSAADIAASVRNALLEELGQINKVAQIHGVGVPLVVTPTSRTAGTVVQTIVTSGDTVTVSAA